MTDNKQLLENHETLFSSKIGKNERITLIERDKVVSENGEIAETFKSYFETIVEI